MFGVDSEEEGDHDSSYDGPNSDAEDAADWEADEWQREIDEAEMELGGAVSCQQGPHGHGVLLRAVGT